MIYTYVKTYGSKLLVRERGSAGQDFIKRVADFRPVMYLPANEGEFFDIKKKYRLKKKVFDSITHAKGFVQDYATSENTPIFGMGNFSYQYIQEKYPKNQHFDKDRIRLGILDIEVASPDGFPKPEIAAEVLNALTYYDSFSGRYAVFGLHGWNKESSVLDAGLLNLVDYHECTDEAQLLRSFIDYYETAMPDILSGWYSNSFDLLYIANRITRVLGGSHAKRLSPFGIIHIKEKKSKFQKIQTHIDIVGVNQLDYIELYKKHTFKMRNSYTLGNIAHVELKDSKLSYDEVSSLHELYLTNYQKYIDYNIKDVEIVKRLDDKLKLFYLVLDMAWYAGVNLEDTFSPVKIWDGMMYDDLINHNVVIPYSAPTSYKDGTFDGAFVKEPIHGLNKWCISFDLTSLYPSIMREWNLGPDTLIETQVDGLEGVQSTNLVQPILDGCEIPTDVLKRDNLCLAGNGTVYRADVESFMNRNMKNLLEQRGESKKEMLRLYKQLAGMKNTDPGYDALKTKADALYIRQDAMKRLANSGYGAMGNTHFRFFDIRIAEAVTSTGQLVEKWVEKRINDYLNGLFKEDRDWVFAMDTDSLYLDASAFITKFSTPDWTIDRKVDFLSDVAVRIQTDVIDAGFQLLQKKLNCPEQLMKMKREVISSSSFWKAKKKYAMLVQDSEGVRKESIKIMGLESVSSRTPVHCKEGIETAIGLVLKTRNERELIKFCSDFRADFENKSPEDIAFGISVNNIFKYSDSAGFPIGKCPYNVKAALLYNKLRSQYHIIGKAFPEISEGDKVKLLYLKMPNPSHHATIAFPDYLPKEFDLHDYIDYETMFEKSFLHPMRSMVSTFGFAVEATNDITDFFE